MMKTNVELDFVATGLRLKSMRKIRGLSQEELAEMLHTSRNQISRIERGLSNPSLSLLVRWCQILDISLDDLLMGDDNFHESSYQIAKKINQLPLSDRLLLEMIVDQKLTKLEPEPIMEADPVAKE